MRAMSTTTQPKPVFQPPSSQHFQRLLTPAYWYFQPRLLHAERLKPERPTLLVGNHSIFGVIDSPLFVSELYRKTGVYPRSLGDHIHFKLPVWGPLLSKYGAIDGTRANCRELMQRGEPILVFPGGAREVAKRRDELHRLHWKQRTGFVRMAVENGYDIVPFASAGCDFSYDILFDGDDFRHSRAGKWLLKQERINRWLRNGDIFMPWVKGVGPSLMPRPEPFLFALGDAIPTEAFQGQQDDPEVLWALRNQTSDAIHELLDELLERQQKRPLSFWRRRLVKR